MVASIFGSDFVVSAFGDGRSVSGGSKTVEVVSIFCDHGVLFLLLWSETISLEFTIF